MLRLQVKPIMSIENFPQIEFIFVIESTCQMNVFTKLKKKTLKNIENCPLNFVYLALKHKFESSFIHKKNLDQNLCRECTKSVMLNFFGQLPKIFGEDSHPENSPLDSSHRQTPHPHAEAQRSEVSQIFIHTIFSNLFLQEIQF